jgi:hypothetical protein
MLSHPCGEVDAISRTIADPQTFFTLDAAGEPVLISRDRVRYSVKRENGVHHFHMLLSEFLN